MTSIKTTVSTMTANLAKPSIGNYSETTFNNALGRIKDASAVTKRDVQQAIKHGVLFMLESDKQIDTSKLSIAMDLVVKLKTLPNIQCQRYIEAVAPVKWGAKKNRKTGKKVYRFAMAKKGTFDTALLSNTKWYDYEHKKLNPVKDWNQDTIVKMLETHIEKGDCADIEKAQAMLNALKEVA